MKYAPIYIPTLCRYEHFVRCVESLKRNTWASKTDVFVALDYPAKESHRKGYESICEYLKGDFSMFRKFFVFKRAENYGASRNSSEMREWILQRYDCYIRTDDDIEFSPNFLEYMDKCLTYYENDSDVVAVSGYSYPVNWRVSEGSTVLKQNCACPMWGTGFWRDRHAKIKEEICSGYFRNNAEDIMKGSTIGRLSDARIVDLSGALSLEDDGLMFKFADVSIGTYLGVSSKWVITPVISKSRNLGFDGSGTWCPITVVNKKKEISALNYDYSQQLIDEDTSFELIPDQQNDVQNNIYEFNQFDSRTEKEVRHAKAKIKLYEKIGGGYFRLLRLKKRLEFIIKKKRI